MSASFEEDLRRDQWGARLRTALTPTGEWLPTVITKAHERLLQVRVTHKNAGGLIIATDQDHARAIARLLKRDHQITPKIALSDDPKASQVIADFAASGDPWVIAVRMISEGVDIPRLRVGVFATTTATALFFRQAVGRIARWTHGLPSQKAYMFVPDDPRMRLHALTIAQERRHAIEARRTTEADPSQLDPQRDKTPPGEQLSLFEALSSSVTGTQGDTLGEPTASHDGLDPTEDLPADVRDLTGFDVELPPPPPLPGRQPDPRASLAELRTRESEKRDLRDFNAARVAELVRMTGWDHARVNAELNKRAGMPSIAEATVRQLEKRVTEADKWLKSL